MTHTIPCTHRMPRIGVHTTHNRPEPTKKSRRPSFLTAIPVQTVTVTETERQVKVQTMTVTERQVKVYLLRAEIEHLKRLRLRIENLHLQRKLSAPVPVPVQPPVPASPTPQASYCCGLWWCPSRLRSQATPL